MKILPTTFVSFLFLLSISSSAYAVEASPTPSANPSALPSSGSPWSVEQPACNNICGPLVNKDGKIEGLSGSVGWTSVDDQWCANHGAQTNSAVSQSTNLVPVTAQASPCPIPMYQGDTSCYQTEGELAHCQYHNGQVEQQCQAYAAAEQTLSGQTAMIAMDSVVAATCATACVSENFPGAQGVIIACRDGGMAANAAEIIVTLSQKSSAMAKAIQGATAAMGIGTSLKAAAGFENDTTAAGGQDASYSGYFGGQKANAGPGGHNRDKAACTNALMFGMMAGERYMSLRSAKSTEESACGQVLALATTSSVVGSGIILPPSMLGDGGSTGSAGSTGSTSTASGALNCIGSGGAVSTCTGTSTTVAPSDASLLSSGLGQQAAPAAAQLAPSIASGLDSGTGSGAGAIGAAGGSGAGDAGNAVMTVASAAQENAADLRGEVEGTRLSASGGGGGGGGEEANPLAGLADLLKPQGGAAAGGGTTTFSAQQTTDIWHTNSTDNLFQIVSGRIGKTSTKLLSQ
jgi:hypothetical protein